MNLKITPQMLTAIETILRHGNQVELRVEQGRLVLVNHYEFAPSDQYTAVNYLCLGDTWKLPIPMVYLEKTPAETPAASSVANE